MKIIDITRTVQEAPIYPGANPVIIDRIIDIAKGDEYNASLITAGSHMGSHADALTHFLADSDVSIDKMPLERYYGRCMVITVPLGAIGADDLRGMIEGAERLVLHTAGQAFLAESAARYIVECGIRTVVTDALSVTFLDNEKPVHTILMKAGIAIVENVVLDGVADGEYILAAFPVKYGGCDGAPVRAVLIQE